MPSRPAPRQTIKTPKLIWPEACRCWKALAPNSIWHAFPWRWVEVRIGRKDWEGAANLLRQASSLASDCSLQMEEAKAQDLLKEIETARVQNSVR